MWWPRWLVPIGLVLVGSLIVVGALTGQGSTGQAASSAHLAGERIEPPSAQEEALWAVVGLNDAWYIVNGYTENPPPSAPLINVNTSLATSYRNTSDFPLESPAIKLLAKE